ncbi:MAG: toll/interleukin-1 receptor domain-containing protein [Chitinophagaceae bacterium]
MKILDSITVQQPNKVAEVQLFQGDLSNIPPEQKVDILVVSAFPDDYTALPGSLVLALEEKGLSMKELAANKSDDLRAQVGCWLSGPIPAPLQAKLNFRQVLCFEPGSESSDAVEVVGNIFRCLNTFVFEETVTRVALPVIATGYQKVPFEKMFPVLIDNAIFWLKQGLPLDCIKIVIRNEDYIEKAKALFALAGNQLLPKSPPSVSNTDSPPSKGTRTKKSVSRGAMMQEDMIEPIAPASQPAAVDSKNTHIDYFISYAHKEGNLIQHFVEELLKIKPGLNIFYDKNSIPPGGLWLREISDAISKAVKVLIFMSPNYSNSMVCWDEFQCAKLKEYNNRTSVIQTIYLNNDPALPPIMGIHSYIDCREGDLAKLATACEQLLTN